MQTAFDILAKLTQRGLNLSAPQFLSTIFEIVAFIGIIVPSITTTIYSNDIYT